MRFAGLALIAALLACSTLIAPHAVTAEPAPVIRIGMTAGGGMYSTQAPIIVLAAPRTSSLRAAKNLEGKTLAITGKGDQNQVAIDAWMSRNG